MDRNEWQKIKEVFHRTLDLPEAEREKFLAKQTDSVRAEVGGLLASHEKSTHFIEASAFDELGLNEKSLIGQTIGGYKILKLIGKGGMGIVFLAEKEDLEKKVALKIIKRGMDTDAVLRRFRLERQILSRLEHENIARLFDGGTTADGLPFFAMEYVEGMTVTHFCHENKLDIEARLRLFRKICAAVHYAHQNLIVHRDLKPSNIIVTKDGTPKLLDFGIAKLLGSEAIEETATQAKMFTPEYASPEQINGLPMTTTTDIYSLGVILYELLSGQRPFQSSLRNYREIAQKVLTEEPPRPSSVVSVAPFSGEDAPTKINLLPTRRQQHETNPQTPVTNPKSLKGDLDNIILKALRKEPARRYQSALEFSEDIRRHLVGLPVSATADTFGYRFSKFISRHRRGALAGFAAAILLLTISGVAVRQAIIANREREKAENRFAQVRKLANLVIFDYHDRIAKLSGATATREKMVKDSLEFLDSLAVESGTDNPDLQREIVRAYKKVGDIQGAPDTGNVGETQASLQSYQKAFAIQESLVKAEPQNLEDRIMLGELSLEIGLQLRDFGEEAQAEENFRQSLAIFSELSKNAPENFKLQSILAKTFWNIANLQTAQNNLDGSLENYQKAVELYHQLAIDDAGTPRHSRNEALTYKNMGSVLQLRGENDKALEFFRKALEIDLQKVANDPKDVSAQLDLSFTYGTLASALRGKLDLTGAVENYRKAVEIRAKIFNADPQNAFAEQALARGYQETGKTLLMLRKYDEAVKNISDAKDIFQKMANADAENLEKKAVLADTFALLGYASGLRDNFAEADEFYRQSFTIFDDLSAKNKLSALDQTRFADAYAKYGEILAKNRQFAEAARFFDKSRELFESEKVRKDSAENLAVLYESIADTKRRLDNKSSEAGDFYRKSLEMWDERRRTGKISDEFLKKPDEVRRKLAQT